MKFDIDSIDESEDDLPVIITPEQSKKNFDEMVSERIGNETADEKRLIGDIIADTKKYISL